MASSDHAADGATRDTFQPDADDTYSDDATSFRADVSGKPGRALRPSPARADGRLEPAHCPDVGPEPLLGRGWDASGCRSADGDTLRPARGRGDLERPNFNIPVAPNGYAWWYVDGLSDCGTRAVSVIGFIGSVFSPWYRWSGRKNPQNHVCINIATYGRGGRFTMTDRGQSALRQTASRLEVGPSCMRWDAGQLVIDICEVSSHPMISKVEGQIRVSPAAITSVELTLTTDWAHVWRPISPLARIDDESFDLSLVGPFSENPSGVIELTGAGVDGPPHGYFLNGDLPGGTLVTLDRDTAEVTAPVSLDPGGFGSLAIAWWGGDFYVFKGEGETWPKLI